MTPRSRQENAQKLVSLFKRRYREATGEVFYPNWPQIKIAEKVARFYEIEDIEHAIDYYFQYNKDANLWHFLEHIDKYVHSYNLGQDASERLTELMDKTKRRMADFEPGSGTDNESPGNERDFEGN